MAKDDFGKLLRDVRRKAGKTLEDVADHLAVSIPYVSDVERGNRAPFAPEKIRSLASYLEVDAASLLVTAARCRGAYELNPERSVRHREVGAGLMRGWDELPPKALDEIDEIVQRYRGSK